MQSGCGGVVLGSLHLDVVLARGLRLDFTILAINACSTDGQGRPEVRDFCRKVFRKE